MKKKSSSQHKLVFCSGFSFVSALSEAGWKSQYERTRNHCIHGLGCKNGSSCKTGCRITEIHLLCGGIIPLLSALEIAMEKHADKLELTKDSRSLRVVRVELDGGQRLVGLRYPEQLIPEVTLFLREQKLVDALLDKQRIGILDVAASLKDTSKHSQGYKEAESPINSRTLTKATTPLVTIKKFFKPKPSGESSKVTGNPTGSVEETGIDKGRHGGECNAHFVKEEITNSPCMSNSSTCNKQEVSADRIKEVKSVYFSSKESKRDGLSESGTSATDPGRSTNVTHHISEPLSKENVQLKTSVKRTNSEATSRTNKRQKQSSILSSFGKGTIKPAEKAKKKEICCPICGVKFGKEVKNAEINEHIDGCLVT